MFVPSLLDVNQLRFVSQEVCDIYLTVQTLDKLVLKSHATLRTMFELTYSVINATWYGYADYGTVSDASLHTALRMVWNCQNITKKGNLVFGQSHKLEVSLQAVPTASVSIEAIWFFSDPKNIASSSTTANLILLLLKLP